jgi:glycosyltransferase involved in cell wall biosynthesis
MPHLLSVIMPCFNSERTVKQAVESLFRQPLKTPFEVVMVDDGSSDSTPQIIKELCSTHKEIRAFFHDKNLGGGAARNLAVEKSKGDIIFCLDSDDLMGENMLDPMVQMITEKKLDGVGVHISKKFIGDNIDKISFVNEFGYADEIVPFESLFDGSVCALYSTFMHTREAFEICGGYPTDHGFDTQAFAFRFLSNGLKASVCPGATYLHRVNFHRSYYIREYEAGRVAENCMKIYEEFFYLFSETIQQKLLRVDLSGQQIMPTTLISDEKEKYAQGYKQLIRPHGRELYEQELLKSKKKSVYDLYWLGCYQLQKKEYQLALLSFAAVMNEGVSSLWVKQKFFAAAEGLTGLLTPELIKGMSRNKNSLGKKVQLGFLQKRNDVVRFIRQII